MKRTFPNGTIDKDAPMIPISKLLRFAHQRAAVDHRPPEQRFGPLGPKLHILEAIYGEEVARAVFKKHGKHWSCVYAAPPLEWVKAVKDRCFVNPKLEADQVPFRWFRHPCHVFPAAQLEAAP